MAGNAGSASQVRRRASGMDARLRSQYCMLSVAAYSFAFNLLFSIARRTNHWYNLRGSDQNACSMEIRLRARGTQRALMLCMMADVISVMGR